VANILYVKSSPRGDASVSAQVAEALIDELRLADPSLTFAKVRSFLAGASG
jgi:FMN-dependent NADH-azoreductase